MSAFTLMRTVRILPVLCAAFMSHTATSQVVGPERISLKPGNSSVVATVPCARDVAPADAAKVLMWPNSSTIVVTSPPDRHEDLVFTANIGSKVSLSGTDCDPPLVNRQYIVSFNAAPEVSGQALQTSFQVLVAAFVLALLLESAFSLLFNWRPFKVLVVGRAWRTPIMLIASWLVVSQFKFDLMAQLFNAYYPKNSQPTGSWGTTLLTSMILAGGSVGVNRILTTLGFRSQVKSENEQPTLDESHAWISIEVTHAERDRRFVVAITAVTPPTGASIETAVGIVGNPRPSLKSIFSGNTNRLPVSGGLQVLAANYYSITVRDVSNNKRYDSNGKELTDGVQPAIFRFAPRAVLDFRVRIT